MCYQGTQARKRKKAAAAVESYNTSYDSYHHSCHNRTKSSYELAISNGMIKIGELKAKAKESSYKLLSREATVEQSRSEAKLRRGEATTMRSYDSAKL